MKLMMIAMTLRHRAGLETVGGWMDGWMDGWAALVHCRA
jgi:hypothetical protein